MSEQQKRPENQSGEELTPVEKMTVDHIEAAVMGQAQENHVDTGGDSDEWRDMEADLASGGGGGGKTCEWEFSTCHEPGSYSLAPFMDWHTGQPEVYHLCQKHYVMWLETMADVIGEVTSNRRFHNGRELTNFIYGKCVLTWDHPSDAPVEARPMPEAWLRQYINSEIVADPLRPEDSDIPDTEATPLRAGYISDVEAAIARRIDAYLDAHSLTLAAPRKKGRKENERDTAWRSRVIRKVFEPLLASSHGESEALRRIPEVPDDAIDAVPIHMP